MEAELEAAREQLREREAQVEAAARLNRRLLDQLAADQRVNEPPMTPKQPELLGMLMSDLVGALKIDENALAQKAQHEHEQPSQGEGKVGDDDMGERQATPYQAGVRAALTAIAEAIKALGASPELRKEERGQGARAASPSREAPVEKRAKVA